MPHISHWLGNPSCPGLALPAYIIRSPFLSLLSPLHLPHPNLTAGVSGWFRRKLGWAVRCSVLWTWYRNCLLLESTLTGKLDGSQTWGGYSYTMCIAKQRKLVGKSEVVQKHTWREGSQEARPSHVQVRSCPWVQIFHLSEIALKHFCFLWPDSLG